VTFQNPTGESYAKNSACAQVWPAPRFPSGPCASQDVRAEDGPDHATQSADPIKTASPIKHVIIIVGENRSFDHLFATYMPKSRDERVLNLLSERIVKADGTPNENFDRAHQFQITSARMADPRIRNSRVLHRTRLLRVSTPAME
jgi:hypothetical protein